jgi:hypothetical protein
MPSAFPTGTPPIHSRNFANTNPEGIKSFSPALAMRSPTLGDGAMKSSTLKGLNGAA